MTVHMDYLGSLLKCRIRFSRSGKGGRGAESLHFKKQPGNGDADAAGPSGSKSLKC